MRGERYMSNARTRPSTTKKGASKERGYKRAEGEARRTGQAEGALSPCVGVYTHSSNYLYGIPEAR